MYNKKFTFLSMYRLNLSNSYLFKENNITNAVKIITDLDQAKTTDSYQLN